MDIMPSRAINNTMVGRCRCRLGRTVELVVVVGWTEFILVGIVFL